MKSLSHRTPQSAWSPGVSREIQGGQPLNQVTKLMISCRILGGGRVQGLGDRGGFGGDETSLFYWCSSLVKSEPSWLHPEELEFKAKKVILVYNY